jgi:hypothetical protein
MFGSLGVRIERIRKSSGHAVTTDIKYQGWLFGAQSAWRDRENWTRRPRWKQRWAASGDMATKRPHARAHGLDGSFRSQRLQRLRRQTRGLHRFSATSISPPSRASRGRGERGPRKTQSFSIEEIVQSSLCDPERRGCLLINLALEIVPHDRELGAGISGCLAKSALFRRSIKAAQEQRCAGAPERRRTVSWPYCRPSR